MIGGRESLAEHFSAALRAGVLHLAAHSHHPWPDVTREAHLRAWDVAARDLDGKWATVLETELPQARRHVAGRLGLTDPDDIAFAQNTHELLLRICSALPTPMRVLTTDAEFHSATRQLDRWAEAGLALVERVPAEPLHSFPERFVDAMGPEHDLILFSHVFYSSGFVVPDVAQIVSAVPDERTFVVVDGYHAFMALPTSITPIQDRAFYLAGGYKYAMAGEGVCFVNAPPGYAQRPVNTGWFAAFDHLADSPGTGSRGVTYARGGQRLAGSTFDPTGLFRFNAVQRWLDDLGVGVAEIHGHVSGLQDRVLAGLTQRPGILAGAELIPATGCDRGHFLTYRTPAAGQIARTLTERQVLVDHRADRLRLGLGVYHDEEDVDRLIKEFGRV